MVFLNKFTGALLGQAVGEAFISPISMDKGEVNLDFIDYIINGRNYKAGEWGKNTEMTIEITSQLIKHKVMGQGIFTDEVNRKIIDDSTIPGWVVPLGLLRSGRPALAAGDIEEIFSNWLVTDSDDLVARCKAVSAAISVAVFSPEADDIIEAAIQFSEYKSSRVVHDNLQEIVKILRISHEIDGFKEFSNGANTDKSIALAFGLFRIFPDNYEKLLLEIKNFEPYHLTLAIIAGSLVGTFGGVELIPDRWMNDVNDQDKIRGLTKQLHECFKSQVANS